MRMMSDVEREWLKSLAAGCVPTPPWTSAKKAAKQARDEYIVSMYEVGVPVVDIADAANLSRFAITAIVKRERATGRHIVRPRARVASSRPSYRRLLTDEELDDLKVLDGSVPRLRNGRRFMWSDNGRALLDEMLRLREDRVALASLASALGVSRQAIHGMTKNALAKAAREQGEHPEDIVPSAEQVHDV